MGAFADQRIDLLPKEIRALLAGSAEEMKILRNRVAAGLITGPGFVVLGGFGRLGPEFGKESLITVSRCLGDVVPQDRAGTLVREVRDRGKRVGEGRSGRYSDSRYGGDLHTDGAESPLPVPDYFTLFCVRQAVTGGSLQLAPLKRILQRLSTMPDVIRTLSENFHFDRRGDEREDEAPTTTKPVLFRADDGRPAVTYLRTYIEVGHAHQGVPDLSDEQRRALDALDESLADPGLIIQDRLRPGELAVFDNLRLLHGRTEFVDSSEPERKRLLYRTWIRRTDIGRVTA